MRRAGCGGVGGRSPGTRGLRDHADVVPGEVLARTVASFGRELSAGTQHGGDQVATNEAECLTAALLPSREQGGARRGYPPAPGNYSAGIGACRGAATPRRLRPAGPKGPNVQAKASRRPAITAIIPAAFSPWSSPRARGAKAAAQ